MDTTKLKLALADLIQQRNSIESVISQLQAIILSAEGSTTPEITQVSDDASNSNGTPSYIEDAVRVLRQSGKPLHIKEIIQQIIALRGRPIHRNSVEASVNRHVLKAKASRRLSRFGPSIYGLSEWKETQPTLVQIASLSKRR